MCIRDSTYLKGWYAISEANRIFGFDGWNRETIESRCALARENRGTFYAVYIARVRVTVQADGATVIRDGHGTGKAAGHPPARCTISPSRPPRPTQPSGRWPPSAGRLVLSSIGAARPQHNRSPCPHRPSRDLLTIVSGSTPMTRRRSQGRPPICLLYTS